MVAWWWINDDSFKSEILKLIIDESCYDQANPHDSNVRPAEEYSLSCAGLLTDEVFRKFFPRRVYGGNNYEINHPGWIVNWIVIVNSELDSFHGNPIHNYWIPMKTIQFTIDNPITPFPTKHQ